MFDDRSRMRLATSALMLALAASPLDAAESAQRAAEALYAAYLEVRPSGLPDESQLRSLRPVLSPTLATLLNDALRLRNEVAKRDPPDSKPPLVDGCLFASLFEGPHAYRVVETQPANDRRLKVVVELTYRDPYRSGEDFKWRDAVLVVHSDAGWLVDDVEYLGDWEFMIGRGTTLVGVLSDEVREWRNRVQKPRRGRRTRR